MPNMINTIKLLNPWRKDGSVNEEIAKLYKRDFFNKLQELKKYKQVIIFSGLRRVGYWKIIKKNK